MPRKVRKKIGRKLKGEYKKNLIHVVSWTTHNEHNYCLDQNLDTGSTDYHDNQDWSTAMLRFFGTHSQSQSEQESELTDSDGVTANEFYVILDRPYMYHPDEDVDLFVTRISQERAQQKFAALRKSVNDSYRIFQNYSIINTQGSMKLLQHYPSEIPTVKWTLSVNSNCAMSISVHRKIIPSDHDFWLGIPNIACGVADIKKVTEKLDSFSVCCGNWENKFVDLIPPGAVITSNKSTTSAFREDNCGSSHYSATIRSTKCSFLVRNSERCQPCVVYRGSLRKKISRNENSPPSCPENAVNFNRPHETMSRTQLVEKIGHLKRTNEALVKDNTKLRRQIQKEIASNGEIFNESTSNELVQLVQSHTREVHQNYPDENSLHRLFWDEQLKYNQLKDKRGMRWHPMIVKWSLYLQHKSRKTYEALRDSGFITLPSNRTLFDYSHVLPNQLGLNPEVTRHLISEMAGYNIKCNEHTAFVGLLQDEIKVKEGLVYDSASDELVGYTDLDKTSNNLIDLENVFTNEKRKLATCMLVVMVRGITTNLKYPFAAFATLGVTADLLYNIIWNCVKTLEIDCGLKVLFVTCDGASPNRKFFGMHQEGNSQVPTYFTWNTYATPRRKLFFISDVPHLMKTTRNCFANSSSHKLSRKLWKDGKDISWMHIVNLFEDYCETNLYRLCPKLTRAHVDLTAFSQMKVNLAAQVLSKTVADALEELYGDQVTETVKFVRHMNKFFDCLNVRSLSEGRKTRNRDRDIYCEADDDRLDYLMNDFLGYFDSWRESVTDRPGNFTKGQRSSMMLSHQTLEGLQISVRSIVECVRFMLSKGADFVLTHRFNQDPLEEHFAHYRQKGGSNDNPSVYQVRNTLCTMRTVGSQAIATVRGNITNKQHSVRTVDQQPLPKKQRRKV